MIKNNEEQSLAIQYMIDGYNVFLTGSAGVGKSHIINEFLDYCNKHKKSIALAAPTGIAAVNIHGTTLHRLIKAPLGPIIGYDTKELKTLDNLDTIIIDEISMCRVDLFDYFGATVDSANKRRAKKNKAPIQVIVVGDFFQLPPVIVPNDREMLQSEYTNLGKGFAFNSVYWKYFNFKMIRLKKIMRQDDEKMCKALNFVRFGDARVLDYFNTYSSTELIDDAIYLCGTNKEAFEYNSKKFNELIGEEREYKASIDGEVKSSDMVTDEILSLKVGARVMALINNNSCGYCSGDIGTVSYMDDDYVIVDFDSGTNCKIDYYSFEIVGYEFDGKSVNRNVIGTFSQLPLKLAYAITIHKSQGQTYDKVNLNPYCWDCGQLYVALSRVRKIENLHLTKRIYSTYLVTSPDVIRFYNSNM